MEGNYLSPIIDAFKPILIFAVVVWGAETIVTMLIKDHKKAKRKQEREKRRLEYQDRRMANDAEHAKVTRAMRYDVLRRDNFHCVCCGRGKEELTVMETQQGDYKRYEFVWAAAGETGEQLGRAVILDDGNYHYCLSVLRPANPEVPSQVVWSQVFQSFSLS